jgi:uncharacterized protein (DUF58 family)
MTLVPSSKLIWWTGIVFLPFTALAATVSSAVVVVVIMVAGLTIIALIDAVLVIGRLSSVQVELPEVMRLTNGRAGEILIRIHNERLHLKRLRLGLSFPRGISSPYMDMMIDLPPEEVDSFVKWPCKALKQGRYLMENCYLETQSSLGLWALRGMKPAQLELRVFPNLFIERKNLIGLFLNRGIGVHVQRQVGKGREFEKLREYMPGDSFEDIHWKATAKRAQPITKAYQIERTQQVYIMLDMSRLSNRISNLSDLNTAPGNMHTTLLERFITAALVMGLAAERQGDLFGLATFDNMVRKFVRAKNGKAHYNTCRDILYTLQPQNVSPDFEEIFTFIGTHLRRRALLIFLTHLDDPELARSFNQHVGLISRMHVILVNMLKPSLANPLFSTPAIESMDEIYQHLGGHLLWCSLRETEKVLQRQGVGFALLENEKLCSELVTRYLSIKQRQIL